MAPFPANARPLAVEIATCIDRYYLANPELTVMQSLAALEIVRDKLTEELIKYHQWKRTHGT